MTDAPPDLHTTPTSMEDWRRKALNLSAHDRLGYVLSRAFEVMIVAKDGTDGQNLAYNLKSLEKDRRLAMQFEENRNDPLRELVYGMCESFLEMMDAIKQRASSQGDQAASSAEESSGESKAMFICPAVMKEIKEECMDTALDILNKFPPTIAHLRPARATSMFARPRPRATRESLTGDDNAMSSASSTTSRKRPAPGSTPVTVEVPKPPPQTSKPAEKPKRKNIFDDDSDFEDLFKPKKDNSSRRSIVKSDRRFKCDECSWSFDKPSALNTHKLVHSNTKGHSCHHCPAAFRTESVLKHHLREAHAVAPFGCSGAGCPDRFMRKEEQVQHRKSCSAVSAAAAATPKRMKIMKDEEKEEKE